MFINVISIDFFITTQYTFSLIKASNQTHWSFFDDLKEVSFFSSTDLFKSLLLLVVVIEVPVVLVVFFDIAEFWSNQYHVDISSNYKQNEWKNILTMVSQFLPPQYPSIYKTTIFSLPKKFLSYL